MAMRKGTCFILVLAMLLALCASASADADMRRAVLGADLTEEQIAAVYQSFGVTRGSVPELKVTNAEERQYLEGYVNDKIIGTLSISSVYVELLPVGAGLDVRTSNVSWCTAEMYISALATAGISDARIIVAAPFSVSGTAALTGVYKAYEDITGEYLSSAAKQESTQELTVTGSLANEIGSQQSASIVEEVKNTLGDTASMSDEELRQKIQAIAANYGVTLTENQLQQLVSLSRGLALLDPGAIQSRLDEAQETLDKVTETKDQVVGCWGKAKAFFGKARDFFGKLSSLFGD